MVSVRPPRRTQASDWTAPGLKDTFDMGRSSNRLGTNDRAKVLCRAMPKGDMGRKQTSPKTHKGCLIPGIGEAAAFLGCQAPSRHKMTYGSVL